MISKGKIAGLLALCSLATLTCGFSAWIVGGNQVNTPDVDIAIGDVEEYEYTLSELGFNKYYTIRNSSNQITRVVSGSNLQKISVNGKDQIVSAYELEMPASLDTNIISSKIRNDENNLFLSISFSFFDSNGKEFVSNGSVESISVRTLNYDYFSFDCSKKNGLLVFPMKTTTRMSLYELAMMDSTYPIYYSGHVDYAVPLVFKASFLSSASSLLESYSQYRMTYGLYVEKGGN